jgi:hypothetical protein
MEKLKGHLSEELLNTLTDIKHHHVESEHPDHHWHLLEVKDQVVLDLGCGFHLIEPGWDTTPNYFIKKGAKKVIGIDPACGDIDVLRKTHPEHEFYCEFINSIDKLDYYINGKNITSLKMDIEGDEVAFINSPSNYPTLKHVAIESHNRSILNNVIKKLINLNFTIDTVCTFYPRVYEVCNLVYASRK